MSLKSGAQPVKKVPMVVADGAGNADVGMAKEMQGLRALETNENTSRTSLDGMQESLHFSVPQAFYHRAWVLCAVDPDVKKDPVLTTRLTRFGIWGRGGAMADTTLTLPRGDEKPADGIEQVGSMEYTADQKKIKVPLYLVRVDLKAGDILDILADQKDPYAPMKIGPYLDFEFLGKCGGLEVQTDRRRKPLPTSTSAVHVFGVTLEKAPVELRLKQSQPGNIFHNDEAPETTFVLRAKTAGRYELRWEITSVDGRVLVKKAKTVELGVKAAKFIRDRFPQLKIIAGNSGGSSGMIAVMLRRGFPRDLIDYLGSETTGQTFAPEKLVPHATGGIWLMGETARKFDYDIPLAGCFEYTSRAERDLGAQRHAEWYARDMLIGLAFRFPTISPAGIEDVGNAYHDTLWGASGLCRRNPLHYPKPAYVALATLTKVLDSVKLVRQMPSGSSSAYTLEFERGKDRIYALWTPRGECEMEFGFPTDTAVAQVEFYGRQNSLKTNGKRLTITAAGAVNYIISPIAATKITAGKRTFPNHQPPVGTQVISHMDDLAQWQLVPDEQTITTPLRRPGKFDIRQVNDAEKGACLELELKREGKVPHVVGGR